MSSEIIAVKSFLSQQFVRTSSEWIEACISFVKEEHTQALPLHSLKNFVYQQWLNADLEEIGVSALPSELSTAQKTVLNGSYVLQVNGFRDVGRPAYAQLKELEESLNSNADFSAEPPPVRPQWEEKPSRMLLFTLTDGLTTVQGMEYKPIKTLSPNLNPGVKVLIQGPINCRFGVLLLTEENIKILGGDVESKLVPFSRRNLLRQALQLPPVDNETQPSEDSTDQHSASVLSTVNDNSNSTFAPSVNHSRADNAFTLNSNSAVRTSRNHLFSTAETRQETQTNTYVTPRAYNDVQSVDSIEDFEDDDDDFVQNLDYQALDQIERSSQMNQQSNSFGTIDDEPDICLEDEDMLLEAMAFQDENPGFDMPFAEADESTPAKKSNDEAKPFTYLSAVQKNSTTEFVATIKGLSTTVLSKLNCTLKGWSLSVTINDGTGTLDVDIDDQILEKILGVPGAEMFKIFEQAKQDPENPFKKKKAAEGFNIVRSSTAKLKDFNCPMDIKFSPNCRPCVVKCYPADHLQQ